MLKSLRFMAVLSLLVVCPALIGIGWWQRDYLLGWYLTRNLLQSQGVEKKSCIDSLAKLGENAQFPILDHLDTADTSQAPDLFLALSQLVESWGGISSPASTRCLSRLTLRFNGFSDPSQCESLRAVSCWAAKERQGKSFPLLSESARLLLGEIIYGNNSSALEPALNLAQVMAENPSVEMKTRLKEFVHHVMEKGSPELKIKTIQATLKNSLCDVSQVAIALNDNSAEVRRAAMIACGPALEHVSVDVLLPSLHDKDKETRSLCEASLMARGLKPEQIGLGKLLTDPSPGKRLQVLDSLMEDSDIDATIWLRKLSHDTSPAVRAAALRAMSHWQTADLTDRIDQMAKTDPNQTVANLADYYLRTGRIRVQ